MLVCFVGLHKVGSHQTDPAARQYRHFSHADPVQWQGYHSGGDLAGLRNARTAWRGRARPPASGPLARPPSGSIPLPSLSKLQRLTSRKC